MVDRLEQWSKQEVCAVIRFLNAKMMSVVEIHRQLVDVYGKGVMSCQSVAKWCTKFRTGRVTTVDCVRSGRSTIVGMAENKIDIEHVILENRRIIITELTHNLGLSRRTVSRSIEQLGYHKVCA
ncbi:hypothetical protein ANN_24751 [Periplaneta americana]|uniref:Mos1 transposase HTH domain-containing protein n=1 Tax=Periplaneta americana TaxID=6978 RepID=A0ABQ8RZT7_PERAM|nr:hypothetical protein ANN_24751 [Periplaneta americana]